MTVRTTWRRYFAIFWTIRLLVVSFEIYGLSLSIELWRQLTALKLSNIDSYDTQYFLKILKFFGYCLSLTWYISWRWYKWPFEPLGEGFGYLVQILYTIPNADHFFWNLRIIIEYRIMETIENFKTFKYWSIWHSIFSEDPEGFRILTIIALLYQLTMI